MKCTAIELFAGVGGFRVGLNEVTYKNGVTKEKRNFKFLWANQWEPSTKTQEAFDCYKAHFKDNVSNKNICEISSDEIPNHSLLVGGFPCQDYSVARGLSKEEGINGKKGVLWWEIYRILKEKNTPFALLENVDRLLKSPAKQRGRDFGLMLKSLDILGYDVQWRVINAADYGFNQKRKRTYIFIYKRNTRYASNLYEIKKHDILKKYGLFAKNFKILDIFDEKEINLQHYDDLVKVTNEFQFDFRDNGILKNGIIYTAKTTPRLMRQAKLRDILDESSVTSNLFLSEPQIAKQKYLKGSKKITRVSKTGLRYQYSEGAMSFPDSLDKPGRTMLTSESTCNRSTHVIEDPIAHKIRILSPIEAERLNNFPDNRTDTGMSNRKRYFMMGNALVCGVIQSLSKDLKKIIIDEK